MPASTSAETPRQQARRERDGQVSQLEKDRRRSRRRRVLAGVAIALALALVAGVIAVTAYIVRLDRRIDQRREVAGAGIEKALAEPPSDPREPYYVLLLGTDWRPDEGVARADTIILARFDPLNDRVALLSIPRDTRAEVPGQGTTKIAHAYAFGGAPLMIEAVSDFTELPISHYVEVDFEGFERIVDTIGGVEIDVPAAIDDPLAGRTSGEETAEAYLIEPGEQVLDGKHALTFVRSREYADGDFTRMANQQLFMKALLSQTLSLSNLPDATRIVDAGIENLTTDMTLSELFGAAWMVRGLEDGALEAKTVPGEARYSGGAWYVIVDEAAFDELLTDLSSGEPIESGGVTVPDYEPSSITVTVRNGSGLNGVASDAADRLTGLGFPVSDVGNMGQFAYDDTLVVYHDDDAQATFVRESIEFGKVAPSSGLYSFDTDVLVIVGRDWTIRDDDESGRQGTPQ
jgi:LCP family protein required for cell wall assembly